MSQNQSHNHVGDFEEWISTFLREYNQASGLDVYAIKNASVILNTCYQEIVEEKIRPLMRPSSTRIDRYKIVSAMQMAIMHIKPISISKDPAPNRFNANFAHFVGLTVIANWHKDIVFTEDAWALPEFEREHIFWLRSEKEDDGFPVFSNAATWYLYERIAMERSGYPRNKPSTPQNLTATG